MRVLLMRVLLEVASPSSDSLRFADTFFSEPMAESSAANERSA